jgi:hypothetical protein
MPAPDDVPLTIADDTSVIADQGQDIGPIAACPGGGQVRALIPHRKNRCSCLATTPRG